jgi:hypothetical protein
LTSKEWRESSDRQRVHYILLLKLALNEESGGTLRLGDAIAETRATREELAANPLLNVRRLVLKVLFYPHDEEERRRRERLRRFKIGRTQRERAANLSRTSTQTVENQPNDRDVSETSRRHLLDISETSRLQQSKPPEKSCTSRVELVQKKEFDQKLDPSIYNKQRDDSTVQQCTVEKEYNSWNGERVGDARGRERGNELLPNWAQTLSFRLRNGEHWTITAELLETLRSVHKESDIRDQSRLAAVWLETNPAKRKTESGMPSFIAKWLGRSRGAQK